MEQLSLWATTIEAVLWSLGAATTEACKPRAHTPQQEKLPQREACALQLESSPPSPKLGKSLSSNEDPAQAKKKKIELMILGSWLTKTTGI